MRCSALFYCMLLATRFHFAKESDLYVGKFVVAERGTEKNGRMDVQGSAKRRVAGCVNAASKSRQM